MKFKIITLGCKVNSYESEYMLEKLKDSGYLYDEEKPDIIIINTCSVTNTADAKSMKLVRRAKREYKEAILVVVGCSSQNNQGKYKEMGIDILLGNKNKSEIVSILEEYLQTRNPIVYFTNERKLPFEDMRLDRFTTHTRAFVKIQDGCDNFCSYCIIPFTRGSIRSKDFYDVIEEVQRLVLNGHKEIVLTGIHTGSYFSNGHDLSDLITELSKIDGLFRIRISSIEITELNDRFLDLLKTNTKIVSHLHIPLQSGSDAVLKRMNRKYDTAYFKDKINKIRKIRPDISITTDCIVGHPYESNECFLEYLDFCRKLEFSKLHVFPYSLRSGTAAAAMPQIDEKVKKERVHQLLSLSNLLEDQYCNQFLGEELEVLTEEYDGDYTVGFTSNYLRVYLKGKYFLNQMIPVQILRIEDGKIIGQDVKSSNYCSNCI